MHDIDILNAAVDEAGAAAVVGQHGGQLDSGRSHDYDLIKATNLVSRTMEPGTKKLCGKRWQMGRLLVHLLALGSTFIISS